MTALAIMAGVIGVAACVDDLWRRQISNWIPCSAFAGGVILQSVQHGLRGAGSALAGSAAGFAVFLVFYLLGGMGGGDVKLMAGFGALLGVKQLLAAALWTAGCGGLLALGVIAFRALRNRRVAKPERAQTGAAASVHKTDCIPLRSGDCGGRLVKPGGRGMTAIEVVACGFTSASECGRERYGS